FRQLKASGHETYVLGLPDFRELSTARGLDFVTFGEQAFPRDSLPTENPMNAFFRSARRYRAFVDAWIAAFARHRPAILLADSLVPVAALAAHKAGVRVVTLHVNYPYTREPDVPPQTTALLPDSSWRGRLRSALAWRQALVARALVDNLRPLLAGPHEPNIL